MDTKIITGTKRLTFGDKSIHRLWQNSDEDQLLDGAYICYVNNDNTYAVDIIAMEYRLTATGGYIIFIPVYEQFEYLRKDFMTSLISNTMI